MLKRKVEKEGYCERIFVCGASPYLIWFFTPPDSLSYTSFCPIPQFLVSEAPRFVIPLSRFPDIGAASSCGPCVYTPDVPFCGRYDMRHSVLVGSTPWLVGGICACWAYSASPGFSPVASPGYGCSTFLLSRSAHPLCHSPPIPWYTSPLLPCASMSWLSIPTFLESSPLL